MECLSWKECLSQIRLLPGFLFPLLYSSDVFHQINSALVLLPSSPWYLHNIIYNSRNVEFCFIPLALHQVFLFSLPTHPAREIERYSSTLGLGNITIFSFNTETLFPFFIFISINNNNFRVHSFCNHIKLLCFRWKWLKFNLRMFQSLNEVWSC